jgi:hypothetical protein
LLTERKHLSRGHVWTKLELHAVEKIDGHQEPGALVAIGKRMSLRNAAQEHSRLVEGGGVRIVAGVRLERSSDDLLDEA